MPESISLSSEYKNTSLVNQDGLTATVKTLDEYITLLNIIRKTDDYKFPESSINLPFDTKIYQNTKSLAAQKSTNELKFIIVIGIGGSHLGSLAVYEAIYGKTDTLNKKRFPKIIFADTPSPKLLESIKEILANEATKPQDFIINLISKSGTTTESIVLFETLYSFLSNRLGNINDRIIVTTDFDSKLWKISKEKDLSLLEIPKEIVGRYSVFSPVGLLPLFLAQIDVEQLLEGAKDIQTICLSNDISKNISLISASLIYLQSKNGKNILDNFFFNPELESVGKWYRQLMAESLGKEKDINGTNVHTGITPIVSIGSTDLHSMIQLYLGGPKDKFTNFVYAPQNTPSETPDKLLLPNLVEGIEDKSCGEIMSAIFRGVKTAYKQNGTPFMEISLPQISEYSLGQYLQFKMIEIMFLAKLMSVNAFDEPDVEKYKKETRTILKPV